MPHEMSFFAALVAGLLGSTHCAAMCGGIVQLLARGADAAPAANPPLARLAAYNLGRICIYVLVGTVAGALGAAVGRGLPSNVFLLATRALSVVFLVAVALQLLGRRTFLLRLEQAGGYLWRRLGPLGEKIFPVTSVPQAFALGLIWGWLPCGLVYTALAWAVASGSAAGGGLLMLGFGLGTLPSLVLIGASAVSLQTLQSKPLLRTGAASLLLLMAGWVIVQTLGNGHVPGLGHRH